MSKLSIRKRVWVAVPALGLAAATALSFAGPVARPAGATVPKLYASPTGTGTTCGKTTQCSLSVAQSHALSFTTIVLAPGVYTNYSTTVTQPNLTIEGPKAGGAVLRKTNATTPAANAATPSGAPVTALLYVGPAAVNFKLLHVTIDGSQAKLPSDAGFAGIYVRSTTASLSFVSTVGMFPGGVFDGAQQGDNILVRSDNAATAHVDMTGLAITDYNKNGITCKDPGTTCNITKSSVTGEGPTAVTAQNGIEFFGSAGTISRTTVSGNAYTGGDPQASGVLIIDAVSGVVVTGNTFTNNDNQLYVYQDGTTYPTTSANVQVTKNVSNNAAAYDGLSFDSVTGAFVSQNKINGTGSDDGFGIGLYGVTNSTVIKNTINGAFSDGIYLGGPGNLTATSSGNAVTKNHVFGSGGDGIHADTSSHNNTFTSNAAKTSSGYDVHDEGTANTWTGQHCSTHAEGSPGGIC